MNIPNALTISRIPALFLIVGLMYHGREFAMITFWMYVAACVTDFLDGYLARKWGQSTEFGVLMDAVIDKIMMIGLMIVMVNTERIPLTVGNFELPRCVPVFLLLIIVGREFLVTGIRAVAAKKGHLIPADKSGKFKTLIQMTSMGAFLAADAMPTYRWEFSYLGLFLFVAAAVLTVSSGVHYFRKYQQISG